MKNRTLLHFAIPLLFVVSCGVADPSKNTSGANNQNSANSTNNTNSVNNQNNADMGPDVPLVGDPLRVATFNVQRFFDTVCDSGRCEPGDFEAAKSPAEFNFQAQSIASAIADINADVIVLQEIETEACLDALMDELDGVYTVSVMGETGGSASLDVATLSRGELLEVRTHKDEEILQRPDGSSTTFARELLEVHVDIEGQRVVSFAAHFKSQRNDDPGRRFAEAEAAGRILADTAEEFPDAIVFLGGDLNDVPESAPVDALLEGGDLELLTDGDGDLWTYTFSGDFYIYDHVVVARNGLWAADGFPVAVRGGGGGLAGSDHSAVQVDLVILEQ